MLWLIRNRFAGSYRPLISRSRGYASSDQASAANRAHSHVTKVAASHLSMLSRPQAVVDVIVAAARSVR